MQRNFHFVGDEEDAVGFEAPDVEAVFVTPSAFVEVDVKPERGKVKTFITSVYFHQSSCHVLYQFTRTLHSD